MGQTFCLFYSPRNKIPSVPVEVGAVFLQVLRLLPGFVAAKLGEDG